MPSPLALDENLQMDEKYQQLLSLYYIRSGAKAVIPGAHTGEFALNDNSLLNRWLGLIKEMTWQFGKDMVLMAMVGGDQAIEQAKLAADHNYDAVMIAPTAFSGRTTDEVIELFQEVSQIIPTLAFELQRAIPGSYQFTSELWEGIFSLVYGAKGASFDTYRSLVMLEAAANSHRKEDVVLFTGNDDRIVTDLLNSYKFQTPDGKVSVNYQGGLLGHFATDTKAATTWFQAIQKKKESGLWDFNLSEDELSHGVNRCNMALFDAIGNFENSVWGVKYRLYSMGLLPGPYCQHEKGREGQDRAIDSIYLEYPDLNDNQFVKEVLPDLKREIGF